MVDVEFRYLTGLKSGLFRNARLRGSWDDHGFYSDTWSELPMVPLVTEDGCEGFQLLVSLDASQAGRTFRWGVAFDGPSGANVWGVPTEVATADDVARYREFELSAGGGQVDYYLTYARRLGARKYHSPNALTDLRFAVWAPHALAVEVVFSARGYIADDGTGIDPARPTVELTRGADGIWTSPVLANFAAYRGAAYMYRIENAQGEIRYRSDIFSRAQFGRGDIDPEFSHWDGNQTSLDGSKSCSVIVGQDTVAADTSPGAPRVTRPEFWQNEFSNVLPVATRLQDLVIYELHLGALAFGSERVGNLRDGIAFLDHLSDLGVNAVELMPLAEFSGMFGWGYGDTHHLVIESSAGTLDDYKLFVRECHRRGIAVIQDVCYNHYDPSAERAQWQYDSTLPEENIYYWYEGQSAGRSDPEGGYIDNGSSGFAPRYWEEVVRQQFISSAALLLDECHVDGFRVDLTQAFHRDNTVHDGGFSVARANLFGQKLLREWSRTLRMIKPGVFLIAEDHTGWDKVTEAPDVGGLGFNARWDAAFYHHLIGDSDMAGGKARLLKTAGEGGGGPLDLYQFAATLYQSQFDCVVYSESHDEAGNAGGTARTLVTAVNGAPLIGTTRDYAEARARVVFALSLFSAATPMFFMGEETGATKSYRFDSFKDNRENILQDRLGTGALLFRYYRELIAFARRSPAARSHEIDIVHADPSGRVLAFVRKSGEDHLLVIASLSNRAYLDGYVIPDGARIDAGTWREAFNSDAGDYGGAGVGNFGSAVSTSNGRFQALLPANGVLVFRKE
jgi:1,4-alpha-glucan branching enzyme